MLLFLLPTSAYVYDELNAHIINIERIILLMVHFLRLENIHGFTDKSVRKILRLIFLKKKKKRKRHVWYAKQKQNVRCKQNKKTCNFLFSVFTKINIQPCIPSVCVPRTLVILSIIWRTFWFTSSAYNFSSHTWHIFLVGPKSEFK